MKKQFFFIFLHCCSAALLAQNQLALKLTRTEAAFFEQGKLSAKSFYIQTIEKNAPNNYCEEQKDSSLQTRITKYQKLCHYDTPLKKGNYRFEKTHDANRKTLWFSFVTNEQTWDSERKVLESIYFQKTSSDADVTLKYKTELNTTKNERLEKYYRWDEGKKEYAQEGYVRIVFNENGCRVFQDQQYGYFKQSHFDYYDDKSCLLKSIKTLGIDPKTKQWMTESELFYNHSTDGLETKMSAIIHVPWCSQTADSSYLLKDKNGKTLREFSHIYNDKTSREDIYIYNKEGLLEQHDNLFREDSTLQNFLTRWIWRFDSQKNLTFYQHIEDQRTRDSIVNKYEYNIDNQLVKSIKHNGDSTLLYFYDCEKNLSKIEMSGKKQLQQTFQATKFFEYYDYNAPCDAIETSYSDFLTLFPNPASQILQLRFNSIADESEIYLYDIMGKILSSQTLYSAEKSVNIILNISHLSNGVYFLKSKTSRWNNDCEKVDKTRVMIKTKISVASLNKACFILY